MKTWAWKKYAYTTLATKEETETAQKWHKENIILLWGHSTAWNTSPGNLEGINPQVGKKPKRWARSQIGKSQCVPSTDLLVCGKHSKEICLGKSWIALNQLYCCQGNSKRFRHVCAYYSTCRNRVIGLEIMCTAPADHNCRMLHQLPCEIKLVCWPNTRHEVPLCCS